MMRKLWEVMGGAIQLRRGAMQRWKATPGNLAWGLALLAAVSLLTGVAGAFASALPQPGRPPTWERRQALLDTVEYTLSRSPLSTDAQYELTRNLAAWLDLRRELWGLPRPLGQEASHAWQILGQVLSAPYRRLALWLPYSLLVLVAARALGGRATLTEMLATSALYVVPHMLDLLQAVPYLCLPAGLISFGWGAAIYVQAAAVANDLDTPRAVLAVLLPGLAAVALVLVLLSVGVLVWRMAS